MSIDRYAKFISEQARIARLDEAKQLNEKWTAGEVHNEGQHPDNDGKEYGGNRDVDHLHGTLDHPDGHKATFVRTSGGQMQVRVEYNPNKKPPADLQSSAQKAAEEICNRHDEK